MRPGAILKTLQKKTIEGFTVLNMRSFTCQNCVRMSQDWVCSGDAKQFLDFLQCMGSGLVTGWRMFLEPFCSGTWKMLQQMEECDCQERYSFVFVSFVMALSSVLIGYISPAIHYILVTDFCFLK